MTEKHIIVITGNPSWKTAVIDCLPDTFVAAHYPDRDRYVSKLTDSVAAMVLVDGDNDHWQFWSATPKSSPATRRIPMVLIATDKNVLALAEKNGVNFTLNPVEITEKLPQLIHNHARIPDPDRIAQLDCECQEALPTLAIEGVEKFNNREFYPQHDLFEEQWVKTEGPVRDLYRAILQVGVAYYQIERGNHRGARKMLMRAVQWLEILPDTCQTIDVAQLKTDAYAVRDELERISPDEIDSFDMALLKPVNLVAPES